MGQTKSERAMLYMMDRLLLSPTFDELITAGEDHYIESEAETAAAGGAIRSKRPRPSIKVWMGPLEDSRQDGMIALSRGEPDASLN